MRERNDTSHGGGGFARTTRFNSSEFVSFVTSDIDYAIVNVGNPQYWQTISP